MRDAVNGALETARADKRIGKSLEARVKVTVEEKDAFVAGMDPAQLADLLLVSQAEVTVGGELAVTVEAAPGDKCERCWKQSVALGQDSAHPTLCPRCAGVVKKLVDLPQFTL